MVIQSQQQRRTRDILAEALTAVHAPPFMLRRARTGYYDDMASPIACPIKQLIIDAREHHLSGIIKQAQEGHFDAQDWEVEAWGKSREAQAMLDIIMATLPDGYREEGGQVL